MNFRKKEIFNDFEITKHIQSRFPLLCCNHNINDVEENNYGYAYGVTIEQIPFEAEIWSMGDSTNVTFYLPEIKEFNDVNDDPLIKQTTTIKTFHAEHELERSTVLMTGMVDRGTIDSLSVLEAYTQLLIDSQLIEYKTDMLNAAGFLLTDFAGNDVIAISITIEEDGNILAMTPLSWIPFLPEKEHRKSKFCIIK